MKYTMCSEALASTKAHSSRPQEGTCTQPTHRPKDAQNTISTAKVMAIKRTSPPAFLAAMFQQAWIEPARMTKASALRGMDEKKPLAGL
jgi:hypothetical protein